MLLMFWKTVKHEFHAAGRSMLPICAGLIGMALLARGAVWLMQTVDTPAAAIAGTMIIVLFVLACVAAVILTMVLMMVRFARSVFGDEGYLTHTLPVGPHTIILSRLLVSLVSLLASYAAVFIGYKISTAGVKEINSILKFLKDSLEEAGVETTAALLRFAGTILVAMLTQILQIFAAIAIGHSFSTGKTGKSVLFYFVLYAGMQIVSTVALIAVLAVRYVGTAGMSLQAFLLQLDQLQDLSSSMLWFSLAQNLVFCGLFYFLTWIMTKRRLNLA